MYKCHNCVVPALLAVVLVVGVGAARGDGGGGISKPAAQRNPAPAKFMGESGDEGVGAVQADPGLKPPTRFSKFDYEKDSTKSAFNLKHFFLELAPLQRGRG